MTLHFYMDPKQSTGSTDCRHFSHNRLHCCITIEFLYYVEDLNFFPQLRPYSPIQNRNIQCGGAIIQQHRPGGGGVKKIYCFVLLYMSLYLHSQRECCCYPVFYLRREEQRESSPQCSAVLSQNNAFLNSQTHALKRLAAAEATHWLGGAL